MAKGIIIQPQATSPLGSGNRGFWVNSGNELVYENSVAPLNMSQSITDLTSGIATDNLAKLYLNNTGVTILKGTPVYSPVSGEMAPASGNTAAEARIIGVLAEDTLQGSQGPVAYSGLLAGITGFTHGEYVYLDMVSGQLTEVHPAMPTYPSGFTVYIVGVIEGTNLLIQKNLVGTL
jgi:hypothetical protein